MSPTLANFLFEVGNFVVLAAALSWLLFKPVRAVLDRERERHRQLGEESEQLRAEAKADADAANEARQALATELEERRQQGLAEARREAERIVAEAREDVSRRLAETQARLKAESQEGLEALADRLGAAAATSVRSLLESVGGPELDAALVRRACDGVRALRERGDLGEPAIESARPLPEVQRAALEEALGAPFEPRVSPGLGAGVRVTTAVGQIDATADAVAREAARTFRSTARGEHG